MQTRFSLARCFALSACLLPATLPAVVLQKLNPRDSVPVGMEMQFTGTSLERVQGILNGEALTRDHAGEAHLSAGASQMVFKFSRQTVLSSLSFINDGMQGEVRLLASHDGKHWMPLSKEGFTAADRQVSVSPGCVQGRYLKLEFDSRQGGTLRCLRIQGGDTDLDYQVVQNPAGKPVNFASGLGGGRMVYASPAGSASERMVVYDLGQPRQLTEFASVHSRQPVGLKVYALSALPEKEDWRGRLRADPSQVGQPGQLLAEAEDAFGSGHVRIRLDQPVTTRFVALAWQSSAGMADFKAYEIAASGPGVVLHSPRQAPALAAAETSANRSATEVRAGQSSPVLTQALYQPQPVAGVFTAGSSYAAGVTGGLGGSQPGKASQGSRRASKAEEGPPEDEGPPSEEDPDLDWPDVGADWPVVGIDWCFAPSAT